MSVGFLPNTVQPRSIRLEASSFCQLRCPSCPTTSRAIHPAVGSGFLRLEDFRKLVDAQSMGRAIELSNYGEIFLNPHLVGILEYAYRRGVKVSAGEWCQPQHRETRGARGGRQVRGAVVVLLDRRR